MTSPQPVIRGAWRNRSAVIHLEGSRTGLRDLRSADADALAPLMQDVSVQRFMPGAPKTALAFRRFAAWAENQRKTGGHLCLAITMDDEAIGMVQAWALEPQGHTIEWGFVLGRPYWGQGLFHEAANHFVSHAINQLGVERLEARTAIDNARGVAALRRLGAKPEGVLRQCFVLEGGRVDCLLWAILASEWSDTLTAPLDGVETMARPLPLVAVK